jgi:(2Fe-2S) ferredoxin
MTYMVDPRIRWVKRTPTGWILYHPSRHFVQISSQQSAVLLKVALDRVDSTGLDSEDYRELVSMGLIEGRVIADAEPSNVPKKVSD